ncbi:proteasomal ubiquitin receptor ADRM1-like isoform X1 [Diadema setosum]|uniref:proteasomal ubiquitin receptor ADRM1-like isoform X1 n=1 Tax=Diadema setosum TaxID=31175 RepID=UPI003B3A0EFD
MSGALFGGSSAGSRPSSKNLVEFRAGKMELKGTTVTPDKRRGLVYVYQSDDSLMHFCWKDRSSGTLVDDLIIFPDDCEFKRVPQCTTGRVYILKFKSSARKFFFWMQEPKTDKDDETCQKVNDVLNNPPAPGSSGLGGGRGSGGGLPADLGSLGSALGEGGLQSMLGNMDQQQMMQLLSGGGLGGLGPLGLQSLLGGGRSGQSSSETSAPSRAQSSPAARPATTSATPSTTGTSTPATSQSTASSQAARSAAATTTTTTSSGQKPIQLSDLQSILSSMNIPSDPAAAAAAQPAVDLSNLMSSEAMTPILANPEIQQKLIPFLPEGESLPKDPEQLRATLQSPQFQQQALGMFTAAFQSGQLGPLMNQFGLSTEATEAANKGDIEAFSKALQGSSSSGAGSKEKKKDDKGKDDKEGDGGDEEAMSLD